ncbi:MFS cation transporter [Mesoplasma lactucae]|uniref:Uncharacterized protein n=1 Tax=Mesoplasma lactucae ATCC 49193 TaxID=81460 RepID=A0A291IRF6_9MOLU|nr:MFS cation transporter [Mesoplasma lactucae]ATG97271.1 hypothetical protein CP520_00665 [Mesoplasma lactucae ATCC 49193]ATZ20279.1 hypothetical protein MLACT_v1c04580 [Mesoplasma lactucae ATCC 49193]MCL8216450.1 hypothetical protein [Mesoplasma lactucae ATCC 49193]
MLNQSWDLYILSPLFLFFGIISVGYVILKERLSLKWIAFTLEIIFFWVAAGITLTWNSAQMGWSTFSNPVSVMLLFFGTSTLFAVFFKPLATWLTGKLHHRRWFMYLGIATLILAIITTFANTDGTIVGFIFTALFLGIAVANNSLYFLFENEQFYYRIAPTMSATIVSIFILFGTFLGSYIAQLEIFLSRNNSNNNHVILFTLGLLFLTISCIFLTVNKENPTWVRGFNEAILDELPKYNWKVLVGLVGVTFATTVIFTITQSSIVVDFLTAKLLPKHHFDMDLVRPWLNTYSTFYSVPQFLFGYLIYKKVTDKVGYRSIIIVSMSLIFASLVVETFTTNAYVFIFFNLIIALAASQVFYAFFAMAIMWNYRSHGLPITGFVAGSQSLGQFLVTMIVGSIKINDRGIFKDFNAIDLTNAANNTEAINNFANNAGNVIMVLYAILALFIVLLAVIMFFTMKIYFADAMDLNNARINMKRILKNEIKTSINTRTTSSLLENKGE